MSYSLGVCESEREKCLQGERSDGASYRGTEGGRQDMDDGTDGRLNEFSKYRAPRSYRPRPALLRSLDRAARERTELLLQRPHPRLERVELARERTDVRMLGRWSAAAGADLDRRSCRRESSCGRRRSRLLLLLLRREVVVQDVAHGVGDVLRVLLRWSDADGRDGGRERAERACARARGRLAGCDTPPRSLGRMHVVARGAESPQVG